MNLRTEIPHVIARPNRPEPAGRIARPFVAAAMALLLAFIAFAPALAESGEAEMRGFGANRSATVIVIGAFDAGSPADARFMATMLDDRMVEDVFDVMVIDSQPFDRSTLRGLDADTGYMYGVMFSDFQPGLIVVLSQSSTVYVLVQMGDDLDGTLMAFVTADVLASGLDNTDTPYGYTEMPMDSSDTVDSPFEGLTEGNL